MQPPELMAAEFYHRDRLMEAENQRMVRLALAGAPHRPSVLQRLFAFLFGLMRKPAHTPQSSGRLISQPGPLHKGV